MKQSAEGRIARRSRALPAAAAVALVVTAGASGARAASPVVQLQADASLARTSKVARGVGAPNRFRVRATFSTDTPGAQLLTVQRAVLLFPDHAGTNGRRFPSCSAAQIERFDGNVARCPKGAEVGTGSLTAQVVPAGVAAAARVALFNSHRGRTITFNFQTSKPAVINESFDAPLVPQHGRYGEKLAMEVPASLQEVLPGLFVGLQTFDVTLDRAITVHGSRYSYINASACPTSWVMHGDFAFLDSTTGQPAAAAADANVRCRLR